MNDAWISETKDKIETLIRAGHEDEARALLVFLRDRNVEPDGDIKQFQNIVGMPSDLTMQDIRAAEDKQKRQDFILGRSTGFAIAAFLFITTGAWALGAAYLFIDWTVNLGQTTTLTRIILTSLGAFLLYLALAFVLWFVAWAG